MKIYANKKAAKYIRLVAAVVFLFCCSGAIVLPLTSDAFNDNLLEQAVHKGLPVPIVMYHSLMKSSPEMGRYVITPSEFESDLKYLREHGYDAISMTDLINYVEADSDLPPKPVIITFDDGNMNNYYYATPILERYEMKAVISIIGSFSERDSNAEKIFRDYSYLTWEQIKNMHDSGLYEIQNHTYNMHGSSPRMGIKRRQGESMDNYRNVLISDIGKLQHKLMEVTGTTPNTFVYPFGSISKDSVAILKELGFKATLSCVEGVNFIERNKPETLFGLKRNNRPHGVSSNQFFKKICP